MAKKEPTYTEKITSDASLGKIPPQATELEEAVLGAIMIDKETAIEALSILKPEFFYNEVNKVIYDAITNLNKEMQPIDILTVKDQLVKMKRLSEIGGVIYLTKLTSRVASAAHAEFHSRIIAQKFIQRELIRISTEIERRAFDDAEDVDDLLDYSQNQMFTLSEGFIKREVQQIDVIIKEAIKELKKAGEREDGLNGVPSGFTELDRVTSGWQPSDLVIVAARPSMGKTSFVLSMARNIAVEHDTAVAIFSLEMSSVQLVNRLIIAETELNSSAIRTGKLDNNEWNLLERKIKTLEQCKLFIDDTPAISITELRAKARRLVAQHDVKLIIIDYLQLMTAQIEGKGTREQEVSNISRSLKALAKDLNIPVIALSQLNRSIETRAGSKRPHLSDLRESGSLEQDADIVIFIHRPEKVGFDTDEENHSTKGLAQIIIEKHRNGQVCDVKLKFTEHTAKFSDWDDFNVDPNFNDVPTVTMPSKMNEINNSEISKLESNRNFDDSSKAPF